MDNQVRGYKIQNNFSYTVLYSKQDSLEWLPQISSKNSLFTQLSGNVILTGFLTSVAIFVSFMDKLFNVITDDVKLT